MQLTNEKSELNIFVILKLFINKTILNARALRSHFYIIIIHHIFKRKTNNNKTQSFKILT